MCGRIADQPSYVRAADARQQREAIKLKMERWEEQHRHRNSSGFVF